jgi:uncharacterized membrane protein YfcA
MQMVGLIALGLLAGVLSGITGIGGGIIIVPALIFLFGYSAHLAQGTTLALMVPPIGLLAAWAYYQKGFVNLNTAAIIAAGFVAGGYIGAKLAVGLPEVTIRRVFACLLLAVAIKMFLQAPKAG